MSFKVYIIDEYGDMVEQGIFQEKHTALELRRKLIKDGFENITIFERKD